MNLVRKWNKTSAKEFQTYLKTFGMGVNKEFTENTVKTQKPVLAIPVKTVKDIAREISKGDYISFLDLNINEYYENSIINGYLILCIPDFAQLKARLVDFVEEIDNWSTCDTLNFKFPDKDKDKYFNLSKKFIKSSNPFARRVGIRIWFKFINDPKYLQEIFKLMDMFFDEKEHFVNMGLAWFVCECLVKQRDKTVEYLKLQRTSRKVNSIAWQKVKESYRFSDEEKAYLRPLLLRL